MQRWQKKTEADRVDLGYRGKAKGRAGRRGEPLLYRQNQVSGIRASESMSLWHHHRRNFKMAWPRNLYTGPGGGAYTGPGGGLYTGPGGGAYTGPGGGMYTGPGGGMYAGPGGGIYSGPGGGLYTGPGGGLYTGPGGGLYTGPGGGLYTGPGGGMYNGPGDYKAKTPPWYVLVAVLRQKGMHKYADLIEKYLKGRKA